MACFICFDDLDKDQSQGDSDLIFSCGFHDAHIVCAYYWLKHLRRLDTCMYRSRCCICEKEYTIKELTKCFAISEILQKEILRNLKLGDSSYNSPLLASGITLPLDMWHWQECAKAAINFRRKEWIVTIKNVSLQKFSFLSRYRFLEMIRKQSDTDLVFWVSNGAIVDKTFVDDENFFKRLIELCIENAIWDDAAMLYTSGFNKLTKYDKAHFGKLILEHHIQNNVHAVFGYNFDDEQHKHRKFGNGRYSIQFFLMECNKDWRKFILYKIVIPVLVKLELDKDLHYFSKRIFDDIQTFSPAVYESVKLGKVGILTNLLRSDKSQRIYLKYCYKIEKLLKKIQNPIEVYKVINENYVFSTEIFFKLIFRNHKVIK